MADGDSDLRRDAALTLAVLVPVAVAAIRLRAPRSPALFGAGVVGAVVLELLLSRRADRVRAVWADRRVQVLAVSVALAGGGALVSVAGAWVLTALLGGLCGYLAVLGVVVWHRRRGAERNG
jgi:hypothetical protein